MYFCKQSVIKCNTYILRLFANVKATAPKIKASNTQPATITAITVVFSELSLPPSVSSIVVLVLD